MVPVPNLLRHHPQAAATVATAAAAAIGLTAYLLLRKKLTPEEIEERRRTRLATHGRIIDGTLIDAAPHEDSDEAPHALLYSYRISGVTYECGQNVSALTALLPNLGPTSGLFGTPVQVRYDRDNPADSIIIAETWNGLWNQNHGHTAHEHH